ncbi:MAG: ABC-F family ATP-binding cassette domain-containing protein [Nakamurella sp.]
MPVSILPIPAAETAPAHPARTTGRATESFAARVHLPAGQLIATDVTKSYAGRVVLDGIDLRATPGHRIGLVGENGAGKSTLLRLLAGVEDPDGGSIVQPVELTYLAQEPLLAGSIGQVLQQALAPLHEAVRAIEELSARLAVAPDDQVVLADYAATLEWAERHDAWDAHRRAEFAADRLGIADLDSRRQVGTLSGGERTRLALAAMMVTRPSCVLLDEPTNHLDEPAMELLEDFLISLPGIVLVASHDRVFLDRVCTDIVDLDPTGIGTDGRGGRRFGGGFSRYLQLRADARIRWERTYLEQQQEIAELRKQTAIDTSAIAHNRGPRDNDKFIYNFKGSKVDRAVSRRVQDAARRLSIAERGQLRKPPAALQFTGRFAGAPDPADRSGTAVLIRDLEVTGRLAMPFLELPSGSRLLLTGANGSGKSSLLNVICGRLAPSRGTATITARRVGMLDQDVLFDDPAASARLTFERAAGVLDAAVLTDLGLLRSREIDTPVGNLSVGQRRRLGLAILLAGQPDLVLLDEPTNHISLSLAGELEQALATAPATVIVASHDRWLRRRWSGPIQPVGNISTAAS